MLFQPMHSVRACLLRSHGHFKKCSSLERKKKVFADCIETLPSHTIQLALPLSMYKFVLTCHNHLNILNLIMAFEAHDYVLHLKLLRPPPAPHKCPCSMWHCSPSTFLLPKVQLLNAFPDCILPPTHWSILHSP